MKLPVTLHSQWHFSKCLSSQTVPIAQFQTPTSSTKTTSHRCLNYKTKWRKTMDIWVLTHPVMMLPSNVCFFTYFSQIVSLVAVHIPKMAGFGHSSYIHTPCNMNPIISPIKKKSLFFHSLNLSWPWDLLWSRRQCYRHCVGSKAKP